jgi:hypothetical protein
MPSFSASLSSRRPEVACTCCDATLRPSSLIVDGSILLITNEDTNHSRQLTGPPRYVAWLTHRSSNQIINTNPLLTVVKEDQQVQIVDVALDDAVRNVTGVPCTNSTGITCRGMSLWMRFMNWTYGEAPNSQRTANVRTIKVTATGTSISVHERFVQVRFICSAQRCRQD